MRATILAARSALMLVCVAGAACVEFAGSLPRTPADGTFQWVTYENKALGYSIVHPDVLTLQQRGSEAWFAFEGPTFLRILDVDAEAARRRGLWGEQQPVGRATVGGRPATKYMYRHYDFNEYRPMMTYVVEHRGRLLGIEFPMHGYELDPVRQRILDSFTFTTP